MHTSIFSGIVFIESERHDAELVKPIDVSIGGFLSQSQLKTLDDVKELMVTEARRVGANAIVEFAYGQKSPSFLGSLFNLDDVNWYGRGMAAKLPSRVYQEIMENIKS